ncbi:uncharacterized protein QC763_510134 [Podospora pseudopauciseta]|uniref:Nephrocystin 3-like N-terminal domain-containing protein n=1 Tax=Podospora pseudopauciseta TaxID=2093780 RepID=A0ABR0HAI6_9PEZI|nr:hypothetical protein QC763_510134 [Podospora pseudopauciseta]
MALCAVLHQILRQDRLLALKAEVNITQAGDALTGSLTRLWGLLEEVLLHVSLQQSPIICILDALDECDQNDGKELFRKTTNFCKAEREQNTKSKWKFLLTTRPTPRILRGTGRGTQDILGSSRQSSGSVFRN